MLGAVVNRIDKKLAKMTTTLPTALKKLILEMHSLIPVKHRPHTILKLTHVTKTPGELRSLHHICVYIQVA